MSGHVIAVCGKGGVGKTTVSAMLSKILSDSESGRRVLAVDADHAGGLSLALGFDPEKTLNDIRVEVTDKIREGTTAKRTLPQTLDYLLLEALVERDSLAFLAAGRPAEQGCFCALNTFLRQAISTLSAQFDVTIVDAEAGVEQANRDVIESVDQLILVADTSVKSLRVAESVREVVETLDHSPEVSLLINRIRKNDNLDAIRAKTNLPIIGFLPDDDTIRKFDAEERSFLELPNCEVLEALKSIVANLVGN